MGRVMGLLNPKNASDSSSGGGSFKEGNVLVNRSVFKVHKKADAAGQTPTEPFLALVWDITRLDEDLHPLKTEEGEDLKETVIFSLGGTSLQKAHPGMAESQEVEEAEDLGDALNTEGPTVFVVKEGWYPDKRSGIVHLDDSMIKKGFNPKLIDLGWAPIHVGGIYYMKTWIDEANKLPASKDGIERGTPYKVVDKIIRFPYETVAGGKKDKSAVVSGKGKKAAEETATTGNDADEADADDKGPNDKEVILSGILNELTEELDKEELSRKAFNQRVVAKLKGKKVDEKLHVPIMGLLRDDKWVKLNLSKYDMTIDVEKNTVQIGTPA